ncbi:MAG TPA: ABC transporter permease [Brevefilum fermentans]|nr:ABC transporter permease [Brevefilum fermentans]
MKLRELISLILLNLNRRKGRVMLTAIGVVIGTAAVVVLVSLAQGLKQNANAQFGNIAEMSQISVYPDWGSQYSQEVTRTGEHTEPPPITQAVIEDIRALPSVKAAIPRVGVYAMTIMKTGKLESWVNIIGIGIDDLSILGMEMASGTFELSRGTVIMGEEVLKSFYDPASQTVDEPPLVPDLQDQVVTLELTKWSEDDSGNYFETKKALKFKVAGIIRSTRSESDYSVYMSLNDVLDINAWVNGRRFDPKKDGFDTAIVVADDRQNVLNIASQINDMGFMAYTPQKFIEGVNNYFVVLQIIFGGVGGIALLVAAIGIANTMTMAILERTREIGLMKAIGATNQDVLSIFLSESASIGFIGGIGGVLLGLLLGELINIFGSVYMAGQDSGMMGGSSTGILATTPLWLILFALLFSTLIGLISGVYPAVQAASLVPVQALKNE